MGKTEKQKLKLLYIKEILERETDSDHGVTMEYILSRLEEKKIKAERRSIYDDIYWLGSAGYGMEIRTPSGKDKTYRMDKPNKDHLELNEIKLLIDSVVSSKSISEAQTRKIIEKLEKQVSTNDAASLQRQVLIANRVKTMNGTVHYSIDEIHHAISEDHQISFNYIKHNMDKGQVFQGKKVGQTYHASPFALIYTDDNYYLLAYHDGKFKHFRVDRMKNVIMEEFLERQGNEEFEAIDLSAYTKATFGMYGGEVQKVTMLFHKSMVDVVMDKFGSDTFMYKVDENHFKITVPIAVSNQFYGWVLGLGNNVEILEPIDVRDSFKKFVNQIAALYNEP